MLLSYASLLLIAIRDYLTTKVAARLLSLSVTSDVAVCLVSIISHTCPLLFCNGWQLMVPIAKRNIS